MAAPIAGARHLPPDRIAHLDPGPAPRVVLACRTGLRAHNAGRVLQSRWPGRIALLALTDDLLNLLADRLEGDTQALECLRSDALTLVDEAEQDVLSADVVMVEHSGFLLSKDNHSPGPISEPLEHSVLPLPLLDRVCTRRCNNGNRAWPLHHSNSGLAEMLSHGCTPTANTNAGETLGKRPRDTMIACPRGSL